MSGERDVFVCPQITPMDTNVLEICLERVVISGLRRGASYDAFFFVGSAFIESRLHGVAAIVA